MPKIYEKASGKLLGAVSDGELALLVDQLEEESSTDQDYYIDGDTVEFLAEAGAPATLLDVLRAALGPEQNGEIRWEAD